MSVEETQASEGVAVDTAVESSSPAIDSPVASETEAAPSPAEGTVEAAPDAEAVSTEPELPEFDFSAWDGSRDGLPEMYNDIYSRMNELHDVKYADITSQLEQMQALNDALMIGEEDPRIKDFQTKYESEIAAREELQAQFEAYQQQIDQEIEQEAQLYAQRFRQKHADVFEDPEKAEALFILTENDWEPEVAVKLLDLDADAVRQAIEAKRDGVPDLYALRLAENASRPAPKAKPRPAAKITSGATTRSSPEQQMMDINETSSLDDKRMIVARRALKNARR